MLIRHAKSDWSHAGTGDFDRPLNARGRRNAPQVGRYLASQGLRPQRVLCSTARRTVETVALLAPALGLAAGVIAYEPSAYLASADALLELLRTQDSANWSIALVGHNPGISELALQLAPCPFNEMPTCAAVSLTLAVERWASLQSGCGTLQLYCTPRQLESEPPA